MPAKAGNWLRRGKCKACNINLSPLNFKSQWVQGEALPWREFEGRALNRPAVASLPTLPQQFKRMLQQAFDFLQEAGHGRAIENPVIG